MKQICVFCGSSPGNRPEYEAAAVTLGEILATRGIRLVYGGASVGVMGVIARTVMAHGGQVTGVIPKALAEREVAMEELDDLRIVDSMHERKALMAELSDGFIALPGGIGTLEEFVEVLTWAQLGIHRKPCGLLNTNNYYQSFTQFLDQMVTEGFLPPSSRHMVLVDHRPSGLLEQFSSYEAPTTDKAAWALNFKDR